MASKKVAAAEVIGHGAGMKFAEIPHIAGFLTKKKTSDKTLVLAHRLIYGRPGEALKRKGDLRQFNGFPVEANSKPGMEKKLGAQTLPALRDLAIMFNLERSGEKSAMVSLIAEFLEKPKDFGKSKAVPVVAKKTAAGNKGVVVKKAAAGKKGKAAAAPKKKAAKGGKREAEKQLTPETVESDEDFEEEIASLKKDAAAQE
jgi:hypothetical protein